MQVIKKTNATIIFSIFLYAALAFFLVLMIRITLPYFALSDEVGFLRIKRRVIDIPIWKISFYIHVFTSTFLLFAGFTQFSSSLQRRIPSVHRKMGYFYIVILLLLSAPAGLVMSLLANGGISSKIAFTLLSLLWFYFTLVAYLRARSRDWKAHGEFMLRSFALTVSALTLRGWKYLLVWAFEPAPMDAYRIVAWLGWVPNLLLVEWWIRRKKAR